VLLALLAVLLPTSASWAEHTPAPLPSLAPGQVPVPSGWTCHGTASDLNNATTDDCQVSGWELSGPPTSPEPYPTAVDVLNFPSPPAVTIVGPDPSASPWPVSGELDATSTTTLDCSSSTSEPSPEPSPSPSETTTTEPSPSPSAEPSPEPEPSCAVYASLERGQAFGLWLFLGALLMLAVYGVVRREGRGFRG
jgi:hypothetical protein